MSRLTEARRNSAAASSGGELPIIEKEILTAMCGSRSSSGEPSQSMIFVKFGSSSSGSSATAILTSAL